MLIESLCSNSSGHVCISYNYQVVYVGHHLIMWKPLCVRGDVIDVCHQGILVDGSTRNCDSSSVLCRVLTVCVGVCVCVGGADAWRGAGGKGA